MTLSPMEVSDDHFEHTVTFADGQSTRDTAAYLAALGFPPSEVSQLGHCDLDTLRSLFRQVVSHDSVTLEVLIRNLMLGEAPGLVPSTYAGLYLGMTFSDWTNSRASEDERPGTLSYALEGPLDNAFMASSTDSASSQAGQADSAFSLSNLTNSYATSASSVPLTDTSLPASSEASSDEDEMDISPLLSRSASLPSFPVPAPLTAPVPFPLLDDSA